MRKRPWKIFYILTCKVHDKQRYETLQTMDPIEALNGCPDEALAFLKKIGRPRPWT